MIEVLISYGYIHTTNYTAITRAFTKTYRCDFKIGSVRKSVVTDINEFQQFQKLIPERKTL